MNSINNNLMAANVANNLNYHYGRLATSVERLSSGIRINSAADDAAGLAIRELMRSDIAAFNQGVRNANDAISMLQVADGALAIIDEKLIRMKELAEQAATGTYDSTQRLMIDSEFQSMASEIERIARATDFNGIKLLDGSLSGQHNGRGLNATGAMKIHFGTANDSAEDYYYVEIGDCTTAGLGLRNGNSSSQAAGATGIQRLSVNTMFGNAARAGNNPPTTNDCPDDPPGGSVKNTFPLQPIDRLFATDGTWYSVSEDFKCIIPKGSKNVLINIMGDGAADPTSPNDYGDNDIELFTLSGQHLAGTPLSDYVFRRNALARNSRELGFGVNEYDDTYLNTGPAIYDGTTLNYSTYNNMNIGYSGDCDINDTTPNDGRPDMDDYEILVIDEVTEDLIIWLPGAAGSSFKVYGTFPQADPPPIDPPPVDPPQADPPPVESAPENDLISIKTQEEAQRALTRIDDAIVIKDKVRAHLGALQNRLENTVSNLSIQNESLQAAESRISDTDVATEMTIFVRNQVLTQSAVAMLGQANSYPHMLIGLITG